MAKKADQLNGEEPQLCENCGSLKLQDEEGDWYCPNCDTQIDWEGEDEDV